MKNPLGSHYGSWSLIRPVILSPPNSPHRVTIEKKNKGGRNIRYIHRLELFKRNNKDGIKTVNKMGFFIVTTFLVSITKAILSTIVTLNSGAYLGGACIILPGFNTNAYTGLLGKIL